jgi:hypothetical protein
VLDGAVGVRFGGLLQMIAMLREDKVTIELVLPKTPDYQPQCESHWKNSVRMTWHLANIRSGREGEAVEVAKKNCK